MIQFRPEGESSAAAHPPGNGGPPSQRAALISRALAALNVTPASLAAGAGLDPRDLPLLLAGAGDPDDAVRLARVLERAGADLEQLAQELSAAAREGSV